MEEHKILWTDNRSLPWFLTWALKKNPHKVPAGYTSVTSLLRPKYVRDLEKNCPASGVVKDPLSNYASFRGSAFHAYCAEMLRELNAQSGMDLSIEQQYRAEYKDAWISGTPDLVENISPNYFRIWDFKHVGTYTLIKGDKDGGWDDYEAQLNLYRWLVDPKFERGCQNLSLIFFLSDWNWRKAQTEKDYPKEPIAVRNVPMWSNDQIKAFIMKRINDDGAPCPDSYTWAEPDKFAVIKKGAKRASRVLDKDTDAIAWKAEQDNPAQFDIVKRPGSRLKCERFCDVASICPDYQAYQERINGQAKAV